MKIVKIFYATIMLLSLLGCEDSNNVINTTKNLDGLSLLGFSSGRTLAYIQTDTTISPETFSITIKDTTLSILITGSGNDWIIHKNSEKLVNLKIGASSIIQNGYWKKINGQDSLVFFAAPPLLMERSLNSNLSWEYSTPFYTPDSTPTYLPYYYANFGYQVTKEYIGIETIITPAGEFDAYRFDLLMYTAAFGNDPIASATEFYVPQIGLVKQHLSIGALSRTIILATFSN